MKLNSKLKYGVLSAVVALGLCSSVYGEDGFNEPESNPMIAEPISPDEDAVMPMESPQMDELPTESNPLLETPLEENATQDENGMDMPVHPLEQEPL